ncbi:MAG: FapA family protein, partial [Desulfobacterales bacterium]|nr:FapA family protein [Desulfobacterales bacterium]
MTDTPISEILVLDADEAQGLRVVQILEEQGWNVTYEKASEAALARLEAAGKNPFHLFVTNYKLPRMEGDDILKTARTLSPLTQRMLMVPSNEADLVIRAINKAEINACIVTPASDRDLLDRVKACLKRFRQIMKHEQLKRVTVHQNRQMFQMARRLKKKDQWCQDQISEKKAEKLLLRSSLRKAARTAEAPDTLSGRIDRYDIPMDPQALESEFLKLADFAYALFCSAATKTGLEKPDDGIPPFTEEDASPPIQAAPNNRDEQVDALLKVMFASPENAEFEAACREDDDCVEELLLANFVRVTLSKDQTRAFVQLTDKIPAPELLTVSGILDLLRQNDISYGIEADKDISAWITSVAPEDAPFPIALGEPAVPGKDGNVAYHFEIDYTNPGKLMEDGRIDFRDRGEIPFVNPGDLLAVKTPPKEGKDGMSVSGVSILVEPPFDPVFLAGNGTKTSEDGLSVHAAISGQPHLDPFGEIS